ncbi:MAG: hypothetical protein KF795_12005 [Labilithrix sp.]|nr:hypothetical protein [Labilithrix sp.]
MDRPPKETRRRRARSRWRRPWIRSIVFGSAVVVLTVHAAAFAAAIVFLPRGFELGDIRAWSNTWLPAAAGTVIAGALVRFVFFKSSGLFVSLVSAAIAGGWLAAIVTGNVLFPVSIGVERTVGPAAIAIALGTIAWATKLRTVPSLAAAAAGAAVGVVEVLAQGAPPPSTRPLGGALAEVNGEPTKDDAATGQVSFPCGKEHVRVRPLLTFESRSPDATWTVLAPPEAFGPRRKFDAFFKEKNGFRAHYTDDGVTSLVATKDAKGLDVEAVSKLPRAVYSHLNAFATVYVPFEAAVSFGPTGQETFDVEPEDYPAGRPLRFAYLGADIAFHVVRASEAANGPYAELAKGRLGRDEPLTIELRHRDGSAGTCKLTFKDWAAQVSTEPSPAGWGLPQNSIQLHARGKEALIVLTLAETGPGRGWYSVGHAEGTYKNRIRVDTVMTEAPPAKASAPSPRTR